LALADALLDAHQLLSPALDFCGMNLVLKLEGPSAILTGIPEHSHPVEFCSSNEITQFRKFRFSFARKSDDKGGSQCQIGNRPSHLLDALQEDIGARSSFHALQGRSRGMLQRNVHIRANLLVCCYRLEQSTSDLVRIGIQETDPTKLFNFGQPRKQKGQTVLDPQVFTVTSGVLSNEGQFPHAVCSESLSFSDH